MLACNAQNDTAMTTPKVEKTDQEWKAILSPEQYRILRQKGTERPHTGEYNMHFKDGIYYCAGCESPLFKSEHKFESHCGWPSFDNPISDTAVVEKRDLSYGMIRTEILCASCGGHLGHVFDDGPTENGLRYCINSVALQFDENQDPNTVTEVE